MTPAPKPAIVAALLGAGLVTLLSCGRTWVRAVSDSVVGPGTVEASGRAAAPVAAGLALVLLAAAVLAAVSGRRVRGFTFAVGLAAGLGICVTASAVLTDPGAALVEPARLRTGATNAGDLLGAVHLTSWPAVAIVGGLVAVLASVAGLVLGRRWPDAGRRYERTSGPSTTAATVGAPEPEPRAATVGSAVQRPVVDPIDAWQALSGGVDPTDDGRDALGGGAQREASADAPRPPGTIMGDGYPRADGRAASPARTAGKESDGRVAGST
jgi:uncharacterized membrane protein (TIGR02234 family)